MAREINFTGERKLHKLLGDFYEALLGEPKKYMNHDVEFFKMFGR